MYTREEKLLINSKNYDLLVFLKSPNIYAK